MGAVEEGVGERRELLAAVSALPDPAVGDLAVATLPPVALRVQVEDPLVPTVGAGRLSVPAKLLQEQVRLGLAA